MGEVQEQRYVCRICSKSCVSGKSLGGHMRVHLAQISASKKAASQEKDEIKLESDDHDGQEDGAVSEEKIKHYESNVDFGDGDQSNSYELRENPKKSWKISAPKHGLIKNSISCKECGKEFGSLRALSGHMRSHSSKNKEMHCCKECGKGFDSLRAMFGHMKSHSKRAKVSNVESAESLSDLENFCPIRRKRSRIRYKGTVNPSLSGLDASNSSFSELEEAEEAAKCLVMLSKGVGSCLKLESVTESSDEESAYFGAVASCRSKRLCGIDGDFAYAKAVTEKNMSEFHELNLKSVAGNQTKFDPGVADEFRRDENGLKVNFLCDYRKPSVDAALIEYEQSDELCVTLESADNLASFLPNKSKELLVAAGDESGLEKDWSGNEEVMEDFEIKPKHKRRACYKSTHSQCALGSRIAGHKMQLSSLNMCVDDQLEQESLESSKSKEHECAICFKVFLSGQALGGHKRAHYNGVAESKNREATAATQDIAAAEEMLDLNFPITVDAGTRSRLRLSSWFTEGRHGREAFVLTT